MNLVAKTVATIMMAASIPAFSATPLVSCQCVDYVRNRLQDTLGVQGAKNMRGDAKDWGGNLTALRLRWSGSPRNGNAQPGDVVVFQPKYTPISGSGVNKTYGHIAFVESATYDKIKKTWTITYFGANQGGTLRAGNGCSNVSTSITKYNDFSNESQRTVSYYFLR